MWQVFWKYRLWRERDGVAGRQMDVTPARIAVSARGIDDAGRRLGTGLTTCVDRLNALGCVWGDDDLGQAFFNGCGGSIGFRQARDGLLDAMGHLAFALRGHAVGGVRMAQTYAAAENGDGGAAAWRLDDTPGDYALPPVGVTDSLVRSVPPPLLVVQMLAWLQEMVLMCAWPRGDADGMAQLAVAFDELGGVADDVTGVATRHGQAITGTNIGAGIQAFATSFAKLTSGGGGHLVDAARGCRDLAEFCRYMGREIRAAQAQVLWGAIFVAALWAVSWLTPAGRILEEVVGRAVGTVLRRVLLSAEMRAGLAGAVYVGGLNLVGQRVREDFGLQDGIDWASFGESAGLAFATGGAMGAVHHVLGFGGKRGNPVATFLAGTMRGRLVTNTALGAGVNVSLEASSGDGHVNWGKDLFMAGGMALNGEVMGAFKPTSRGGGPALGDDGAVLLRFADRTGDTAPAPDDPAVRSGDPRAPAGGVRDVIGDPPAAGGVFRETSAGDPGPGMAGEGTGTAPVRLAGTAAGTEPVAWPGRTGPVTHPGGSAAGHGTDPVVPPFRPEGEAFGSPLGEPGVPVPQRGGEPVARLERPPGARLADRGGSGVRPEDEPDALAGRPADPRPHVADLAGHPDELVVPGHSPAGETPAPYSPVVVEHARENLQKLIAELEEHRQALVSDADLASAVLHHHHPDPEVAALDAAIAGKRRELDALGTTAPPPVEVRVAIEGSAETLRVAPGERVVLGRRNDPSVTDQRVSRTHAEFGVDADGRPWIRDLGSINGTVVNHRRIGPGDPAHYLHSGDVVTLGGYTHLDFAVSHPEPGPGEALLFGRRVAERYGLVMVADSDARDFFHAYTEIIGPGESRPTGSDGPLTDLAREVIGREASFVDLLNLHNRAVELGYEPHRAHDRGELLDILRSASDPPTDDDMARAGHRLGRAGGMAPLTDREASGLGMVHNHLTHGAEPDAAGYRRLVEVAHAAGFGDWSAHAAGHGARADRDAVLEMVRLVGNHDRFIIHNARRMAEDLRGIRGFGDPAPGSERFPAHSPASEALAREVLGPDATVADLRDLERGAREMAYRPAVARTHGELVDLLKLAHHDLTGFRSDQERQAFKQTQRLFRIPERDDDTARIVSAMMGEADVFAQERLESAARSGRLGGAAFDDVRYTRLDPDDASLYDLAGRVRPGLEVRDMIELYRYAEETGFHGAHDREDLLKALRRADAALAPDDLIARRVAENLRIDRADAGMLRDLMRAADPAGARRPTLPRAVAHLNWLANQVRPGLPVSDLLADYRYLLGGARNHPGDRAGLIDALRGADRALHPPSERTEPTSALRTLPNVHVDARFVRDDAGPVERWPLSAGTPPTGPIDFTAASGRPLATLREHLEFFHDSEEAPEYWGDGFTTNGGPQIRPLEVGWRLDRKALFRGDGRSADIVFTEGFGMPERGYGSNRELICTTRSVDTAMEFAIMFGRKDGDLWVYVLDAPGGYDIGGGQDEVKFLGGVDRRHIAGALRFPHGLPMRLDSLYDGRDLFRNRPQDQAEWVPNPYYDPSAR